MIDEALLGAFVRELEALRTQGGEFAAMHPDVASALDIGARRSRDGGVERIVQSTAFLSARLRLLIDANAAELPATMLATLAPVLGEPVPSMAIATLEEGHEARAVPRGTRLDHYAGNERALTFVTTADAEPAPVRVSTRRVAPAQGAADALAVRLDGVVPRRPLLYLGRDGITAATLLDALATTLVRVEAHEGGGAKAPIAIATRTLARRGFSPAERALPERAGAHRSYRLMTEFLNFPEKFRFVRLDLPQLRPGCEIVLHFAARVGIEDENVAGAFEANRVPVVNLWEASAAPFDLNGRTLEYPVRVDARRAAPVECHSVEAVTLFEASGGPGTAIDPIVAPARRSASNIQWGVRRAQARGGAALKLHFRGLDYERLGRDPILVSARVLASNGAHAARARAGDALEPTSSLGDWRARLASAPSAYRRALPEGEAMRTLCTYLRSSLRGLCIDAGQRPLRTYLKQFPGAEEAAWIDALGHLSVRPVLTTRDGEPRTATRVFATFDAERARSTSTATVQAMLRALFDAHRPLNAIEEVVLLAE